MMIDDEDDGGGCSGDIYRLCEVDVFWIYCWRIASGCLVGEGVFRGDMGMCAKTV